MTRTRWDKEKRAKGVRINILTPLRADKRVMGDTSQLREALINLILNAVDAMPKGGRLTLSSAVEKKEVVVEVSDTGTGMTDDAKARCMEPFFTTKGVEGTGLGLAMVHGIVTRHNGTMKIDSTLGSGTTIQIRLPFAPAEPMTAEPRKGAAEKGLMIAPLRILVADDDAKSRDLVEKMLTKDGHAIETARTGWEAIDKVHAGTYDLVITDRSMPEGNGDLVALSVKERNPETPVILLTGFGDIMKDEGEHPAGVDRILTKPVSHHDLRHAIIKVMQKGLP
jgi:CheY-like chemotaxis protein